MSDKLINISGVTQSAINAGGTVSGSVTNNIVIRGLEGRQEEKFDLLNLIEQLENLAKQLPLENDDDARKIVKRLKGILAEIEKTNPDTEDVEFNLESLQKAAQNVASVLPTILPIAIEVANRIRLMLP